MNYRTITNEVSDALQRFERRADEIAARSQYEARANLNPGDKVSRYGRRETPTQEGRDAIAALQSETYRELSGIFDRAQSMVDSELAEPPSQDAVNSIGALKLRTRVTQQDVSALLKKYGGNYQARAAIEDVAREKGVMVVDPIPNHDYRIAEAKKQAERYVSGYRYGSSPASVAATGIGLVLEGRDALGKPSDEWGMSASQRMDGYGIAEDITISEIHP